MKNRIIFISIIITICASVLYADFARDVELARRYIALKKYEEARDVLEPLTKEHPDDKNLRNMLKQTYRALKDNRALLSIVETELAENPKDASLWVEDGNIALATGDAEKAKKSFDTAVALAPNDEKQILAIFRSYRTWGYTKEAVALLLDARKRSGKPAAYAMEIASIYEVKGDWNKAADEYGLYLSEFPDRFPDVERRMNEVSADSAQLNDLAKAVEKLRDKGIQGDRIDRMLARLQVRQGNYAGAVRSLIDAEKKRKMKGVYLLGFMKEAQSAGAHDAVIAAGEYLADAEPRFSQESNLTMAVSLRATGQIDRAATILEKLKKSKSATIAAGALVLLGEISFENRGDNDAARQYFSKAIESYPRVPQTAEAYRGLTEVYLREGNLTEAERILAKRRSVAPQDPWALFGLGELFFFKGATDTAGIFFRNVVLSFPKSSEANDAVQYLALMADAASSEDMDRISAAFWSLRQGENARALSEFGDLIEQYSAQPWADLLLWNRAKIELKLNDATSCKADLERIAKDYPDGYHAARAVELLGDLARSDGDLILATQYYNRILADFPDAVNIERVRGKLKIIPGNI